MLARPIRHLLTASASVFVLAAGVSAVPQIAGAWPVGQEETVTLDDFTTTSKQGAVITIKHAEFQGTNLTKDEIVKLLTPDTSTEEGTALLQKMKAGAVSIPLIDVAPKKGGAMHIHDVAASDIDSGKVGKFGFSSVDGAGEDDDGPISIKSGPFLMENADLADVLASAGDPKMVSPASHLGHLSWSDVDLVVPDKEAGPGKTTHIALGAFDLANNYDGETIKDGKLTMKGLVIEPSKGSEFATSLTQFGYSRLELSANIAVHYDAAAKKFSIDDLTISGANAGSIGLKASFEGIEPAIFGSDAAARLGALGGAAISSLEIKLVNGGIFEKSVTYVADQQKTTPEALKKQWMMAAGQMLPAVLGGDPSALKLAAETQKFIAAPSNLTVAVRPKSGSFKFSDAVSMGDPMAALASIDISAAANK